MPLAILRPATGILTGDNGFGRLLSGFFAGHRRPIKASVIHQALLNDETIAIETIIGLINDAVAIGHDIQRVSRPNAPPPTPLIAVDQAEELFAPSDKEESARFLRLITGLFDINRQTQAKFVSEPLFIWTIRADSLDLLLHQAEGGSFKPQPFLLPPIPRDSYREIIEAPLSVANRQGMRATIDPLLTSALVEGSTGADALPLLAFTLRELFAENRSGREAKLTLHDYNAAGGVDGIPKKRLAVAQLAACSSQSTLRRLVIPHLATWDQYASPPAAKRLVAEEAHLLAGTRADLRRLATL